jgi:hypothetical protein
LSHDGRHVSWRDMAVVARDKHYDLLQTEQRIAFLKP